MPTYDYHCEACHKSFSVLLSMKDHERKRIACPKCGSRRIKAKVSTFYAITSRKA